MAHCGRLSFRPGCPRATAFKPLLDMLFGLFSLVYGVSQIVLGVPLRQTGRSVMENHAA